MPSLGNSFLFLFNLSRGVFSFFYFLRRFSFSERFIRSYRDGRSLRVVSKDRAKTKNGDK